MVMSFLSDQNFDRMLVDNTPTAKPNESEPQPTTDIYALLTPPQHWFWNDLPANGGFKRGELIVTVSGERVGLSKLDLSKLELRMAPNKNRVSYPVDPTTGRISSKEPFPTVQDFRLPARTPKPELLCEECKTAIANCIKNGVPTPIKVFKMESALDFSVVGAMEPIKNDIEDFLNQSSFVSPKRTEADDNLIKKFRELARSFNYGSSMLPKVMGIDPGSNEQHTEASFRRRSDGSLEIMGVHIVEHPSGRLSMMGTVKPTPEQWLEINRAEDRMVSMMMQQHSSNTDPTERKTTLSPEMQLALKYPQAKDWIDFDDKGKK